MAAAKVGISVRTTRMLTATSSTHIVNPRLSSYVNPRLSSYVVSFDAGSIILAALLKDQQGPPQGYPPRQAGPY